MFGLASLAAPFVEMNLPQTLKPGCSPGNRAIFFSKRASATSTKRHPQSRIEQEVDKSAVAVAWRAEILFFKCKSDT